MAGIGFELKKLFSRKGLIATIRAYSYATVVCAGPMILGFILLLSCMFMAEAAGATRHSRELVVTILTHTLLASLVMTSLFSMLTTRFCADMIYEKKYRRLIPSFYGSIALMLVLGGIGYGVFLHFSGVRLLYRVIAWVFFMVLIVVWTEISYLTMLKDFRSIMLAFSVSVAVALLLAALLLWVVRMEAVTALLMSVTVGYMIMMLWYFAILYRTFPHGVGSRMYFLRWIDKTPALTVTGFFITLGLFGHLVIMWWASSLRVCVEGLFYGAPTYDVPAIFAFFSILITTVNFTTSVETRFYPRYKEYFSLFNDGGSIESIDEAEESMLHVLADELSYLALRQLFSTLAFIILGTILLPNMALGFNSEMLRIFRTLCIGYAFYAVGNCIMLISQYFSDMRGAFTSTAIFAAVTNVLTLILALTRDFFYGMGFVLGSMAFCIAACLILCGYLRRLKYNVLSRQPLFAGEHRGFFSRIAVGLDRRALRASGTETKKTKTEV